MKILWLVNIVMPELAAHLGRAPSVFGGWLTGSLRTVREHGDELVVCTTEPGVTEPVVYEEQGVRYYLTARTDVPTMAAAFEHILQKEQPDVIHLYGTEFEQSLAMSQVADPARTVATIQGSVILCRDLTFAGLPEKVCRENRIHRWMRRLHKGGECIEQQQKSFAVRAVCEEQVLKKARYIHGGSEWGCSVARWIHPGCTTFDFGLILRDSFYDGTMWKLSECEPHSLYVVFTYPIKGFHQFLEALDIVKQRFPDVKAYVAGNRFVRRSYTGLRRRLMEAAPDYPWVIQEKIDQLDLWDQLVFMGHLNEPQVKERLLKTNAFVSASILENQSTALGEAMMLGVPSVASCVGAMQEMIDDGEDGFLYPFNEPHLLANQICRIFEDSDRAEQFSIKGHEHAARTYDRAENGRKLLDMYEQIMQTAAAEETPSDGLE